VPAELPRENTATGERTDSKSTFTNTLSFDFPLFTPPGVLCLQAVKTNMHLTILHYLFLIPVGLALAFLLWVLWNLTTQLSGRKPADNGQPMISVGVRDRYSIGVPSPRRQRPEATPAAPRGSRPEPSQMHSAPREFTWTPSAPVLGTGLRQASSSTGRGVRR
jgi:hypothetical protein